MADFNKAFNRIFNSKYSGHYDSTIDVSLLHAEEFQNSLQCWGKMRQLGFSQSEILSYIKWVWCKSVWDEICGDGIDYQPLAESMFTFALNNGSDHCIYLLNSMLKLEGGQSLLEGAIKELNKFGGDGLLLRFGMGKIIYYELSDKYRSHQEKASAGIHS